MNKIKRGLSLVLVFVMLITLMPMNAKAATEIKFKKERANVYDNGKDKGEYVYTLNNVSKGQTVKWSVSGKGKKFVTLKYTNKKVTGKTSSNRIFVKTNEELESKNAKFTLKAKIYSKKNVLVQTVSTTATIKSVTNTLKVVGEALSQEILPTGTACMFGTEITPANCTDNVVWTVADQTGEDVSEYITEDGEFTPETPGTYTVKATTYNGTSKRKEASQTIVVEDALIKVEQTATDGLKVQFSSDVEDRFDVTKLSIKGSDTSTVNVKEVKVNSDGKVELATQTNLADGVNYTVTYGSFSVSFKASVGAPATLLILTQTVTVDKWTTIQYSLLDKNGIDVTKIYNGKIEYVPSLTNGIIDGDKILMKTVGASGTIRAIFTPSDANLVAVAGQTTVACTALASSDKSNFTITDTAAAPNYTAADYEDKRTIYLDTTGYVHFRALDTDGDEIKFDSVTYSSSDTDALIVNSSGKVTPIKAKKVTIYVTAKLKDAEYPYKYEVSIEQAPMLSTIQLEKNSIDVSNLSNVDNKAYIKISAWDQFGAKYSMTNESATFVKPSSGSAPAVEYEADQDRILVRPSASTAGIYPYTIKITSGGKSVEANFIVNVSNVPTTGTITYQIQLDEEVVDLAINKETTTDDQCTYLKVAKYVNNIFAGYQTFSVTGITKNGKYYGTSLTAGGGSSIQTYNYQTKLGLVTRKMTDVNAVTCNCVKAETGTYVIGVNYYRSDINKYTTEQVSFAVKDTTGAVQATVNRTTSSETCATALDLVKNCISVKDGQITECSVTGETNPGSKVALVSKDSYHIKNITVATATEIAGGIKVNEVYTVTIDKTLTNK